MKAKFFRYLFHRVTEGICYSGCIKNQIDGRSDNFCFLYLAGGEKCGEEGESYRFAENAYDLVILADFSKGAVERVKHIAKNCRIKEIIFPEGEKEKQEQLILEMKRAGIMRARAITEIEKYRVCREQIWVIPVENSRKTTLALYHEDFEGKPETEECVMCVKLAYPENQCRAQIQDQSHHCEMRCVLYNDFDMCKRQNQKDRKEFLDGYLLCADTAEVWDIEKALCGQADFWKRIRVIGFAGERLKKQDIERLRKSEQRERRYIVGTVCAKPEVINTIYTDNTGQVYFQTGEQAGICFSGYYVKRKKSENSTI